jgi:hypothetical protein
MHNPRAVLVVLGLASLGLIVAGPLSAQDPTAMHLGHVMTGFRGTPEGQGLLPTAMAEAAVAQTHAGLMVRDPSNLGAMKTHAGHVLNALDPAEMANGPGLGYGVRPAAAGVAQHVGLAANADGASQGVKTHSTHVIASAENTVGRATRMIRLAKGIQTAESAEAAATMAEQLNAMAAALTAGTDADGNGSVGWQEGEGGLDIVETHMGLMQGVAPRS